MKELVMVSLEMSVLVEKLSIHPFSEPKEPYYRFM